MTIDDFDSGDENLNDSHIRDALSSYAQYLDAEPITPVPDSVWENIHTTLALEAAEPAMAPVTDLGEHRQRRLGTKWVGGLVAASVTLLAVGIGANLMGSGSNSESDIVMAGAPQSDAVTVAEADPKVMQASFVPPVVTVTSSGNDYSPSNLKSAVTQALQKVGVSSPIDYFKVPMQGMAMRSNAGMMKDEKTLRDCITAITKSETSQALLIDQATYMGMEAGIIIIPFAMFDGMDSMPANTDRMTMGESILARNSDLGILDIWVVEPNCGTVPFAVYSHVTHSLN
jgi:hypothetical protein